MAKKKTPAAPRPPGPGSRGWPGRGGGSAAYVEAAPEWRGTTVQVCGMWPFAAGSGTPMVGVPLGRDLISGAAVCCDPISWFQRANLLLNPSAFVLGKPG
ncbi:ATP/GTP-binding protein, partial [Streptomyces sp. DT225]